MDPIYSARGQVTIGEFFWLTGPFGRISVYPDGIVVLSIEFLFYQKKFQFTPREVKCRRSLVSASFKFLDDNLPEPIICTTFDWKHVQRILVSVGYTVTEVPFSWTNPPDEK